MTDYRAEFDAEVTVLNGGGLQAQRFRLDISSPDVSEPELAAAFVRQLGLLMTDQVGADLAGLPLDALADLPAVVVRVIGRGSRGIGVGALAALDVAGCAVLLHTGWDRFFGTPRLQRSRALPDRRGCPLAGRPRRA